MSWGIMVGNPSHAQPTFYYWVLCTSSAPIAGQFQCSFVDRQCEQSNCRCSFVAGKGQHTPNVVIQKVSLCPSCHFLQHFIHMLLNRTGDSIPNATETKLGANRNPSIEAKQPPEKVVGLFSFSPEPRPKRRTSTNHGLLSALSMPPDQAHFPATIMPVHGTRAVYTRKRHWAGWFIRKIQQRLLTTW